VPEAGPLLDADGSRVGEHGGTPAYTVGQRQGLGVALGEPRYVSRIDPLTNTITLGRRVDLETTDIELERSSFVSEYLYLLRKTGKWWLLPMIALLLGLGALMILSSTAAAPFIYTLF